MTDWPEGWESIELAEHVRSLTAELERELVEGHELYGLAVTLVARARPSDDYLFQLEDGRVAEVHLTFANRPERLPWPITAVFENLQEWRKAVEDER